MGLGSMTAALQPGTKHLWWLLEAFMVAARCAKAWLYMEAYGHVGGWQKGVAGLARLPGGRKVGKPDDLLRLRAMLAQLERSGSCGRCAAGGSGFLWRLGGAFIDLLPVARHLCACARQAVRVGAPFDTSHPNATPVCMCGCSRGPDVRVCASGACV